MTEVVGAKAALFCDGRILTYLRDTREALPWPAHWDLPGGGREAGESAEDCLFREVREEFGLQLTGAHLLWQARFPAMLQPDHVAVFFAGRLCKDEVARIRFGDEGQCWRMMPIAEWLSHPRAIPGLQDRTRSALSALGLKP